MLPNALVINLPESVGRMERMAERLNRLHVPFSRVDGVRMEKRWRREASWRAGHRGCAFAHRRCIATAIEQGWPAVLVFEDDAILRDGFADIVGAAHEQAQALSGEKCDLLYTGAVLIDGKFEAASKNLVRVNQAGGLQAYIVYESGYEKFLSACGRCSDAIRVAIDTEACFPEHGLNRYMVNPICSVQEEGRSLTEGVSREYLLDFLKSPGGDQFADNCQEARDMLVKRTAT